MKVLSVLLVALLCFSASAFAQEGLSTKPEAVPKVFQVTPTKVAALPASRWMQFSDCKGEVACCATLKNKSLQYKEGEPPFSEIPGLAIEVPVDQAYRANGSILITWTLRIEGQTGEIINPWMNLCSWWHGTVVETFKGGQVYSQAYVDIGSGYKPMGQASQMTVPDGGGGTQTTVYDPTHSGSYLLKASDIQGGLPEKVKIKIYWKNDTSLIVTSKAKYRSLIVTVLPMSK